MKKRIELLLLILAIVTITTWCFAANRRAAPPIPDVVTTNPLVGIWEMTVQGNNTYLYKYAISDGTWVANGNIDRGFLNYTFSPTTGAYVKNGDGSYSYRERGWTYTRGGVCNGAFESTGDFQLDASGTSFAGPGVFKIFDLSGNTIVAENFAAVAVKVPVQ